MGREVITHTNNISVPGWTGVGYILFEPDSGQGAFKISGGKNGGDYEVKDPSLDISLFVGGVIADTSETIGKINKEDVLKKLGKIGGGLLGIVEFGLNMTKVSGFCPPSLTVMAAIAATLASMIVMQEATILILRTGIYGSLAKTLMAYTLASIVATMFVDLFLAGFEWVCRKI
jgi:hypothetical protein